MLDATVAMDDGLCERYLTCLVCGQRQGRRSIDLIAAGGTIYAVARCLRCCARDKTGAQLIARLAARRSEAGQVGRQPRRN